MSGHHTAFAALAVTTMLAGGGAGAATPSVHDIAMPGGGSQRVLFDEPAATPRATLVMLPGGSGEIRIDDAGHVGHNDNFLVRTAGLWTDRGFAVMIPDALGGENLRGQRSSALYGDVVAKLVAFAHAQGPAPVVLIGTSQGSIAAMNGAAHLRDGQIAGVVLTESVSRLGGSGETVFDTAAGRVTAPALIVANSDDACPITPPEDAADIAAAMTETHADIVTVAGGEVGKKPCASLSAHGYRGIETQVVDAITAWIDRRL